jgi:hypothetical protein
MRRGVFRLRSQGAALSDLPQSRYGEIPEKIAERLGYVNADQVNRLLDMFHGDWSRFDSVLSC